MTQADNDCTRNLKVVVTDYIEPNLAWEMEKAAEMGVDFSFYQLKNATPEQLLKAVDDAEIIIVNMAAINAEVIAGLKRCRLIIRHGIGYDNVDVQAASEHQIMVGYVPDYCVTEVAEQALMLMLACQRKLNQQLAILNNSAAAGQWLFQPINPVFRMHGKTVGIVGFGRIGRTVFKMLQEFGVKFLVTDPYIGEDVRQQYGIELVPLDTLLVKSDIITIHCPLRWEETYHMFDEPQFKMMKKDAILINTARGGIVNLDALDLALRDREIAMAGIDVYEIEPPGSDFPLIHNERAICTPHLSWLSEEAGWNIREKIMHNVERYINSLPPVHQVNPGVGVYQSQTIS